MNNKLAFYCRKFKRHGNVEKTFSREGVVFTDGETFRMGKQSRCYTLTPWLIFFEILILVKICLIIIIILQCSQATDFE